MNSLRSSPLTIRPGPQEQGRSRPGALDAIQESGWLLIAILAPLWINLWSSQPFDPAKAALLRSLVWFIAGLWLAHCILTRKNPLHDLRRNSLLWPVTALAAVLLAATLLAPDPRLSLFGTYTRAQGLLTLLSYLLLFLVVSTRLRTLQQAQRLLTAMVLTAVPLVALGGAQAAGIDPLGLITDARSPVYATLGRPNFLGAYLAMLLPPTLALLLYARSPRRRAALAALLLAQGVLLALTATRAPLLAAAAGLLAFALLWRWPTWSARRRLRAAAAVLLATLSALLVLLFYVLQAPAGSVAARRVIWRAVWDLIRRRPLLGYGPDSLELVFPAVYPPELVYYQGRDLFVDRAHNLFLDWSVSAGLLGAAALALLLGAFFLLGLRRLSRAPTGASAPALAIRAFLAASLAGVIASLAANLVSFDVTATAAAGWLFMALVASPALAPCKSPALAAPHAPTAAPSRIHHAAAGLLLLAVFFAIVQANVRPLLAGFDHRQATLHAAAGDWPAAVSAAQRAVDRWPAEPQHHLLLGRVHQAHATASGAAASRAAASSAAASSAAAHGALAQAEAAFLAARDLRPRDAAVWSALGNFYHEAGVAFDRQTLALAHDAYREALALAPHSARLHVAWAQVYLDEDRREPATALLQRAVQLDATDALAYRLLGDVTLAAGDPLAALDAYRQAVHWSPGATLAHLGLARSYWALRQPAQAAAALQRAVELDAAHPAVRQVRRQMAP